MKKWDVGREFRNWSRRQVENGQAQFESNMTTPGVLGFQDMDSLAGFIEVRLGCLHKVKSRVND